MRIDRRRQLLLLLGITLLALALRLFRLGAWSFWGDEMSTIRDSQQVFELALAAQKPSRLITHVVLAWAGVSEWSARLFPALTGALSIPILYGPLRRFFGAPVALLSGLLLAVAPWHLYWSQNARFYTPLLLFYTLALLWLFIALEEDHPGFLLLGLGALGLAAWEHLTALLFVPVFATYIVLLEVLPFERPRGLNRRNLLLLVLPGLALGAFFVLPNLTRLDRWFTIFGWINTGPLWMAAGVAFYVGVATMALAAGGAAVLLARRSRAALLLSLAALLPIVAVMAVSLFQFAANRYAFIALSAWLILAAACAWELLQRAGAARWLGVGVLAVLVFTSLSEDALYYRYQHGNRDNWRGALAFVAEQKAPGDTVIMPNVLIGGYYLGEPTVAMADFDPVVAADPGSRIWIVEDMDVAAKYPRVKAWLDAETTLVAVYDVNVRARNFRLRVYFFEAPDPAAANPPANRPATVVDHTLPALSVPGAICSADGWRSRAAY